MHLLAGPDQVAAGGSDHVGIGELAGRGRGRGLVQPAHPLGDFSPGNHRQALECEAQHLHIGRSDRTGDGGGFLAQAAGGHRIALTHQGDVGLLIGEQGVFWGWRKTVQQTLGPLNPAVGDRGLAPEVGVVVREPDCHPSRGPAIIGLSEEPVGALAGVDAGGVLLLPPAGHT
ncbi:MAG: hypothetical protein H0T58_01055 [Gemmatimonadales bacterium]|nr:hypothetical protein [Gemmatimonadales bacterium]